MSVIKRLFCLGLATCFILLTGCAGGVFDTVENTDDVSVSEEAATGRNGLYYANLKSGKFHYNDCTAAAAILNDNLYITESREELVAKGYVPCSICNP